MGGRGCRSNSNVSIEYLSHLLKQYTIMKCRLLTKEAKLSDEIGSGLPPLSPKDAVLASVGRSRRKL